MLVQDASYQMRVRYNLISKPLKKCSLMSFVQISSALSLLMYQPQMFPDGDDYEFM